MQTVSVRIPEDDLAWLSSLQLQGASSPSDKIRALITDAQRRANGENDYVSCAALMREQVRPLQEAAQAYEHATHSHSEIVALLATQLPELMASLVTALPEGKRVAEMAREIEARLTAKAMRMLLGLVRLAVTQRPPTYDPTVLNRYVAELQELVQVVQIARPPA
jgi:Arc/MetJ-type ribon-helix-helix transcriptional regulator